MHLTVGGIILRLFLQLNIHTDKEHLNILESFFGNIVSNQIPPSMQRFTFFPLLLFFQLV